MVRRRRNVRVVGRLKRVGCGDGRCQRLRVGDRRERRDVRHLVGEGVAKVEAGETDDLRQARERRGEVGG